MTGITEVPGSASRFDNPSGVAAEQAGNLYVADTGNSTVRKYAPLELEPSELQSAKCGRWVVLSWSSLWYAYSLESRANPQPGTSWVPVSEPPMKHPRNELYHQRYPGPFNLFPPAQAVSVHFRWAGHPPNWQTAMH